MPRGTLEVILVNAKGLEKTHFFSKLDPYVILTYRTQEHKSSVLHDGGSNPQWNESFLFTVSDSVSELYLKIMDKDRFTRDDFLGEAKINLEPLFVEGSLPETAYSVVKDEKYCGEIKVALTFTPEQTRDLVYDGEENYGGWKESKATY